MVLILKKEASRKEIEEIEEKLYSKNKAPGFNAKKYNGVVTLKRDPLLIQKQLRNEWESNFS